MTTSRAKDSDASAFSMACPPYLITTVLSAYAWMNGSASASTLAVSAFCSRFCWEWITLDIHSVFITSIIGMASVTVLGHQFYQPISYRVSPMRVHPSYVLGLDLTFILDLVYKIRPSSKRDNLKLFGFPHAFRIYRR